MNVPSYLQIYFESPWLLQVTKKIKLFLSVTAKLVKFGLKSALKKICEKELSEGKLFCFRKEAVKLFLSAKAVMVLRSHQKIVKFDGANYSTQLPYSSKY